MASEAERNGKSTTPSALKFTHIERFLCKRELCVQHNPQILLCSTTIASELARHQQQGEIRKWILRLERKPEGQPAARIDESPSRPPA